MSDKPTPECTVALCFTQRGFGYENEAGRKRAARRLAALEQLLPLDPQLRALLLTGVSCVGAEADTLVVCYRTLSSVDSDFFPVTHATSRTWNVLAHSAGFRAIFHQYAGAAFSVELQGAKGDGAASSSETEEVLRGFIGGGFMQMTPFEAVADEDPEITFVDPETSYPEIEKQAEALADALLARNDPPKGPGDDGGRYH